MKKTPLLLIFLSLLGSCSIQDGSSISVLRQSSSSKESSFASSSARSQESSSEEEISSIDSSYTSSEPDKPVSSDFLSFFDYSNRSKITITASSEVLSFISDYQNKKTNRYSDAYLPVDLSIEFNGETYVYEEVGIRMKGNISRSRFYDDGFMGLVHFKVSLKATFDSEVYSDRLLAPFKHDWSSDLAGRKNRKDRNFLGLEKFDLKYIPRNGESQIRETYCFDRFRNDGIYAPYTNIIDFTLSDGHGSLSSAYQITETIDKEFLKRRMGKQESSGDLYKCTYNSMGKADFSRSGAVNTSTFIREKYGKIGVKDSYSLYFPTYDLKTNDDGENSDFANMANLIKVLWTIVYNRGSRQELEKAIDIDSFLHFSAATYLLGNFDDQRYDYNNFYVYFRPSDNKAIFLPYDWDWSLGLDLSGVTATLKPLDPYTLDGGNNSNLYQAVLFGQSGTAIDQSGYREKYLQYVSSISAFYLDIDAFSTMAESIGITDEIVSVRRYMDAKKGNFE